MACLVAASGSLRSQELLAAKPAAVQIFEPNPGQQLDGKACDEAYADVRYLIEELIDQRLESARLSIELAKAKAEGTEIQRISRQQETLVTALMTAVASRDRRDAAVRSETADLRQQLEVARTELQRRGAENDRLAAELAAAHKAAVAATAKAQANLAVIDAQIKARNAAAGNAALARAEHPGELLTAVWIDGVPPIPRQKPHLETTR
jgi:hypothetical protein